MNAPFRQPEYPSDAVIRRNQAERDARDRWHAKYMQANNELQAELDDINRRFRRGEFA